MQCLRCAYQCSAPMLTAAAGPSIADHTLDDYRHNVSTVVFNFLMTAICVTDVIIELPAN